MNVELSIFASNISWSFGDFGIGESSESNQGHYLSYYQKPSYILHYHYPNTQVPPYYQFLNYPQPYYHQAPGHPFHQQMENISRGFLNYIFEQGSRQDDNESQSGGYDPPRYSTMWWCIFFLI